MIKDSQHFLVSLKEGLDLLTQATELYLATGNKYNIYITVPAQVPPLAVSSRVTNNSVIDI